MAFLFFEELTYEKQGYTIIAFNHPYARTCENVSSAHSAEAGNGDVIVNGKGKVTLNAVKSDYKGKTILNSGTVTVKELADAGIPSSIGAASANAENFQIGKVAE